jgi:hypothetical protein
MCMALEGKESEMITRELIKYEIDKMQDQYLDILYRIIKTFGYVHLQESPVPYIEPDKDIDSKKNDWTAFIKRTYGCLADRSYRKRKTR